MPETFTDADLGLSYPQATPQNQQTFTDADLGLTYSFDGASHKFGLADTWPARLAKSIYGAITAPGDAYAGAGNVNPQTPGTWSDEDQARALLNQANLDNRTTDLAAFFGPSAPGALTTRPGPSSISALNNRIPLIEPKPAAPVAGPATADILQAAQRQGIDVPQFAVQSAPIQKVAAGLSDAPLVGTPINRAASTALRQSEDAVANSAASLGSISREGAGSGIQNAVSRFKNEVIPQLSAQAYKPIDDAMPADASFVPSNTAAAIKSINARLAQSNGSLTGEAARIAGAIGDGNGVSYQGLKDLRSALGAQMNDPLNRQGYNDFADSLLYGALSKDLRNSVQKVGGEDLASKWDIANSATAKNWSDFNAAKSFGNQNASPNGLFERVFNMAMDRRGNIDQLQNLKQMASPDEWGNVAATALDRMAKNSSEQFSMPSFVNNYAKMNPDAKSVLFGDAANSVDDLATVFGKLQQIDKYKSKSQSANVLALGGMAGAFWAEPFSATTAAVAGFAGSKWLAQPASAKAYANVAKSYQRLAMRPSEGLAKEVAQRANTFGVVLARQLGIPQAANDIGAQVANSLTSTYQSAIKSAAQPNQDGSGPAISQ